MRCRRIYASSDGKSHFDEVDIPTTKRAIFPDAVPFELSAHYPASWIRFTRIPAAMREVSWHTVPERVLTVRLDGSVECETSDGEVRDVAAGGLSSLRMRMGSATSRVIPWNRRPSCGLHCQVV